MLLTPDLEYIEDKQPARTAGQDGVRADRGISSAAERLHPACPIRAFGALYEANHQRVLLARMVAPQEAEDLTKAAFAKAAKRKLRSFAEVAFQ